MPVGLRSSLRVASSYVYYGTTTSSSSTVELEGRLFDSESLSHRGCQWLSASHDRSQAYKSEVLEGLSRGNPFQVRLQVEPCTTRT